MKTANFIAGIALIAAINSTSAIGLDRSSNSFSSMTAGNGPWVAVDGQGHLLASANRLDWAVQDTGTPFSLYAVVFGNGRFVAAHDAELLASTDGAHFQAGQRLDSTGSVHARRSACGDTEAGFRFVIIGDIDLHGLDGVGRLEPEHLAQE